MPAERCSDSGSGVGLLTPEFGGWSHGIRNMDGNDASTDGWRDLASSPTVLFPGFVSDPCFGKSVPDVHKGGGSVPEDNCKNDGNNSERLEQREDGLSSAVGTDNSGIKSGGSLAERRAAKFGFDASKINTSSFKASGALTLAVCRSPCLLRTPGISPGALLESPIMLPNLQPSPTTGAFGLPNLACESGVINSALPNADKDKDSYDTSSFTFKPHGNFVSFPGYSALQKQHPPGTWAQSSGVEVEFQHSAATHPPVTGSFEFPTQLPSQATINCSEFSSRPDAKAATDTVKATDFHLSHSVGATGVGTQQIECQSREDTGIDHPLGVDQKVLGPSGGTFSTSEDGYNWRKYGQKQVKGSEYPRSYYKCTNPNCPVKKKVEHSHDGQIAEIVYQGTHNHPMPHPDRGTAFSSSALKSDEGGGSISGEGGTVCRDLHHGYDDPKLGPNWRPDGLERTSSASFSTEFSDPLATNEVKSMDASESAETPEPTSTLASNKAEDEEDATQGNMIIMAGDNENEPDMKKRKMEEHPLIETTLASRAIREPRVIVQIESEVDILDDGYRWRKYGQKVVKGNPNPRSYYKCTYPGCTVRKHVERASHNLKCVLTTYEGKHNHEVPSAKNSSHTSSVGGNPAPSLPNSHGALVLPLNPYLPKSEPQDPAAYSNRKSEYNSNFLRPNYFGKFDGGAASIYQMKFPALPNTMLYGAAFGLNLNPDSSTMAQPNPGFSIPPPPGVSTSPNPSIPNNIQGGSLSTIDLSTWDSNQKRAN